MKYQNPFRYFKTSPEIIRLAVMMHVRFPLSLRNVEDLLHERGIGLPRIGGPTCLVGSDAFGCTVGPPGAKRKADRQGLAILPEVQADDIQASYAVAGCCSRRASARRVSALLVAYRRSPVSEDRSGPQEAYPLFHLVQRERIHHVRKRDALRMAAVHDGIHDFRA